MSWLKVDDRMPDHPKIAPLSHGAFRLLLWTWCYCSDHLTDGVVHTAALTRRYRGRSADKWLQELLDANLLERRGSDYAVHDYHDYNPTRARVLARREADRVRQQSHRDKQPGHGVTPRAPARPLIKRESKQQAPTSYECCQQTFGTTDYAEHLDECHQGTQPA